MFSDYIEIRTKGLPEDMHFILSKLFTRIHGVLRSDSLNIGLAFPELGSYSPGSIMRCFGTPKDLEQLRCNDGITHLEKHGMISISPITAVPPDATTIAYRRERNAEKCSAGFKKRQRRRQIRRSALTSGKPGISPATADGANDSSEMKRPAYLLLERSGQRLPIHISTAIIQASSDVCRFSSYGLASKVEGKYSAVPSFWPCCFFKVCNYYE